MVIFPLTVLVIVGVPAAFPTGANLPTCLPPIPKNVTKVVMDSSVAVVMSEMTVLMVVATMVVVEMLDEWWWLSHWWWSWLRS